ncbi:hypothetical protein [uncultured Gimesia sp.]|uniref:hypothetical protein n=1 Tax=uncultured Gimesia sp. TaxID=1678688 RepID=UPI002621EB2B|nr:hypothetical protein [uncultured Gimesia sp.]
MDQIDGQLVGALVVVVGAVYFLTRRVIRFFKQRSGCDGGACTGCDAGPAQSSDFVSLDQLKQSK